MRLFRSFSTRTLMCAAFAGACALGLSARGEILTRVCVLTGDQEVPPNASTASGCGSFLINTDTNTVQYRIVYLGIVETASHIHGFAAPGVNAAVKVALPPGLVKVGSFVYAEADEAAYLGGQAYVNIHTTAFPGGEIRGQIMSAVCKIDGGQEVPPNASAASGFGLFNIDGATNSMTYYIKYAGVVETASHIHGYSLHGAASAVKHALPGGLLKTGTWAFGAADVQKVLDGQTYVNIHSVAFPGGEIRGQIVTTIAPMDGTQEVPAAASNGNGCGFVSLDRTANALAYEVRFGGIGPDVAYHIHGFAPAGSSAGVVHGMPAGNPKRGLWGFGAANLVNVLDDKTYFNIHTAAFGGGEIRGQIVFGSAIPCAPVVTSSPSNLNVMVGGSAMFSVAADGRTGGTPTYQWLKGVTALANGGSISGATSATLTINPVAASDAGSYSCVVTNSCGSVTSGSATLTVDAGCDSIDFNNDGVSPDSGDVDDFLSVYGGGPCSNDPNCGDIDFNNDGVSPDSEDIESLLRVFGGGMC